MHLVFRSSSVIFCETGNPKRNATIAAERCSGCVAEGCVILRYCGNFHLDVMAEQRATDHCTQSALVFREKYGRTGTQRPTK